MRLFESVLLKTPGACLEELWRRVPGYIRWTFFAAVILGLGTHLYVFTNKFANVDDLRYLFLSDYGAASGRWLLPFAAGLDGDLSFPWLIGLLGVLCLAGTACLSTSLLRIRSALGCILAAALVVTFPGSADTFCFMFTADTYFLSMLLAALGAYAAVRWGWWGSAAGALAIALSLGIYQAYLPVAAVLMVGALLFEVLDGEKTGRQLFLKGLRLVGTLAAGLAVYMLVVQVTTGGYLTGYMGLDSMGKISLRELPGMILSAYKGYFRMFIRDDLELHAGLWWVALVLVGLGSCSAGVALLWKRKLGPARTALALLLALLYPLAGDLIFVMGVKGTMHTRMLYGIVYILLLPIGLTEYSAADLGRGRRGILHRGMSWVVAGTMLAAAWNYAIVDNSAYLKADLVTRQCEAYSNRMLGRIESCPGYGPWVEVVLVGSEQWSEDLNTMPQLEDIHIYSAMNLPSLRTAYSYDYFLRCFLGFPAPVYLGSSPEAQELAATEEVREMPLYPQEGSVKMVHCESKDTDTIVVKLGEMTEAPQT